MVKIACIARPLWITSPRVSTPIPKALERRTMSFKSLLARLSRRCKSGLQLALCGLRIDPSRQSPIARHPMPPVFGGLESLEPRLMMSVTMDRFEPNNTGSQPTRLGTILAETDITDLTLTSGDSDWYSFDLPAGVGPTATIMISHGSASMTAELSSYSTGSDRYSDVYLARPRIMYQRV